MSMNTPEYEPGTDEEGEGIPLDGRDGQPAQGGSSDDPRTLESMDPLRDARREADALGGNEARAQDSLPLAEEGRVQEEPDSAAGARVQEPVDTARQETGGPEAPGRTLPEGGQRGDRY